MRRACPLLFCLLLLAAPMPAHAHDEAAEMAQAAGRFVKSLDDEQRALAAHPWEAEHRSRWFFVPDASIRPERKRTGLPIKEMKPHQRQLAHALLASALSPHGNQQALSIMALEQVLYELENKNAIRDPERYYFTIYGEPSRKGTWSWRVEGHHLSINITLVEGKSHSVTPSFFGSNPARVSQGPLAGMEILKEEQSLARALVQSLDEEQQAAAIIATQAPRDIITGNQRKVDKGEFDPAEGIAFDKLNESQQKQLLAIVRLYADKYRPKIIKEIESRKKIESGEGMFFAWAGGIEPGDKHYYRIQTPLFLFEYDNTQNDANHVHTVWRDFDGDFGEDLLRKHYDEDH